jgi:predicted glycosyltransferase involved in capsule biosynthesis
MPKAKGGYAHGNGLIHLESFMKIRGYDEEMIGYGPEDDLFNTRISKINNIIYDNSIENATMHLWHPRFHMIQHKKNMQIWKERKAFYNSLMNPTIEDIKGNKTKKEWGII